MDADAHGQRVPTKIYPRRSAFIRGWSVLRVHSRLIFCVWLQLGSAVLFFLECLINSPRGTIQPLRSLPAVPRASASPLPRDQHWKGGRGSLSVAETGIEDRAPPKSCKLSGRTVYSCRQTSLWWRIVTD